MHHMLPDRAGRRDAVVRDCHRECGARAIGYAATLAGAKVRVTNRMTRNLHKSAR